MTTVWFPLYSEEPHQNIQVLIEGFAQALKGDTMNDFDSVGDYAVPVDPMDDLQCESCQ
jgi:hypothetical protein